MSSQNYAANLKPPTAELKSFPPGASSPAQAALINQQNSNDMQNKIAKLGGRRRRMKNRSRKLRKGGAVPIYSPTVSYPEAGSGSNTVGAVNQNLTNTLMQNKANAEFDKNAVKGGGRRRKSRRSRKSRKLKKRKTHKKGRKY